MDTVAVRLPRNFVDFVSRYAEINLRSVPKQIEYWTRLGRCAEENPDLPLEFIKECMLAQDDAKRGLVSEFEFRTEE